MAFYAKTHFIPPSKSILQTLSSDCFIASYVIKPLGKL